MKKYDVIQFTNRKNQNRNIIGVLIGCAIIGWNVGGLACGSERYIAVTDAAKKGIGMVANTCAETCVKN